MIDERITPSFWWSEFVRSDIAVRLGLDNMPGAMCGANIRNILAPGMQGIREALGAPVLITSGYRSSEVNAKAGGSRQSQHMQGLAADFVSPAFGTPKTIARYLMAHAADIGFGQLIYEGQWVHVGFPALGERAAGQVLTARFVGGSVYYSEGLA